MPAWSLWLLAALALVGVEVSTLTLVAGMAAGGAAAAAAAGALGAGFPVQLVAFAATTTALLGVVRPVARRHLASGPVVADGVAALVGSRGSVVEPVDGTGGRVRLGGEVWSARTQFGEVLPAGTAVSVLEIEGATAVVFAVDAVQA